MNLEFGSKEELIKSLERDDDLYDFFIKLIIPAFKFSVSNLQEENEIQKDKIYNVVKYCEKILEQQPTGAFSYGQINTVKELLKILKD